MYLKKKDIEYFLYELYSKYKIFMDLNMVSFKTLDNQNFYNKKPVNFYGKNIDRLNDKSIEIVEFIITKNRKELGISLRTDINGFQVYISTITSNRVILHDITSLQEILENGFKKYEEGLSILGINEHILKNKINNF
jgi:predicted transcriptional regulator of viral defense system